MPCTAGPGTAAALRLGCPAKPRRALRITPCVSTPWGYMVAGEMIPAGGIRNREDSDMATTEFKVTGMTCSHCEMSIREEVSEIDGVADIQVSAQTGKLVVTADDSVDDAQVLAAVTEAGYSAVRSA